MAFRTVKAGNQEFLFGGESVNLLDAQAEAEAFRTDILGRLRYQVEEGDREFNFEYPKDVYLKVRVTEDGTFGEYYTKSLGDIPAYKRVSLNKDAEGKPLGGCYIGFKEPWVRWNFEENQTEVLYDELQLKNDSENNGELAELGFDEANVWYPVERVKTKTKANPKSHYVFKPL